MTGSAAGVQPGSTVAAPGAIPGLSGYDVQPLAGPPASTTPVDYSPHGFFWSLGHIARGLVDMGRFTDAGHDFAQAWSDPSILHSLGDLMQGVGSTALGVGGTVATSPYTTVRAVGQTDYMLGGYGRRGLATAEEWNQNPQINGSDSVQAFHDKLLNNWGNTNENSNGPSLGQAITANRVNNAETANTQGAEPYRMGNITAPGGIAALQQEYRKTTQNTFVNPFDPAQRAYYFTSPSAPFKTDAKMIDLVASSVVDPLVIAGPIVKAVRYGTMAQGLIDSEKVPLLNSLTGLGTVNGADQQRLLDESLTAATARQAGDTVDAGRKVNATIARWDDNIQKQNALAANTVHYGNTASGGAQAVKSQTAAFLWDIGKDYESQHAADMVLMKLGSSQDQVNAVMLLARKAAEQDPNMGKEVQYVGERLVYGQAENNIALQTGSDVVTDPYMLDQHGAIFSNHTSEGGALYDARNQALLDAANSPVPLINRMGPLQGRFAAAQRNAAFRKIDDLWPTQATDTPVGETVPVGTYHQPTPDHPTMVIVNFAQNVGGKIVNAGKQAGRFGTVLRPEGIYNANDSNHFIEALAYIRQASDLTGGEFTRSGQASDFATKVFSAQDPATRIQVAQNLERAAISAIGDHLRADPKFLSAMDDNQLLSAYDQLNSRRASALAQLKHNGFTSLMDGDSPIIADVPYLRAQQGNVLPLIDLRKFKDAAEIEGYHNSGGFAGMHARVLGSTGGVRASADIINNTFKIGALLRVGYAIRNVGEAAVSTAASGALFRAVGSYGAENAKTLLTNTVRGGNGLIDRMGVRLGHTDSREVDQAYVAGLNTSIGTLDSASMITHNAIVGKTNFRFTPEELDALRAVKDGTLAPGQQEIASRARTRAINVAQLQSLHTGDVTYHYSADGEVTHAQPGLLATTPSPSRASQAMDNAHQYLSAEKWAKTNLTNATPANREQAYNSMLTELKAHSDAGAQIQVKNVAGWQTLKRDALDKRSFSEVNPRSPTHVLQNSYAREEYRVLPKDVNPEVTPIRTYGKTLDVTQLSPETKSMLEATGHSTGKAGINAFHGNKAWEDPQVHDAMHQWMTQNGYGRAIVKDKDWGPTVLANSDFADVGKNGAFRNAFKAYAGPTEGVKNFAAWRWRDAVQNHEHDIFGNLADEHGILKPDAQGRASMDPSGLHPTGLEQALTAAAARRSDRRVYRAARSDMVSKGNAKAAAMGGVEVDPTRYARRINYSSAPSLVPDSAENTAKEIWANGMDQAARGVAMKRASLVAERELALQRLAATDERLARKGLNKPWANAYSKPSVAHTPYGDVPFNGHAAGTGGEIAFRRISAEHTVDKSVSDGHAVINTGPQAMWTYKVRPDEPRYIESWANMLNNHIRNGPERTLDPVVKRIVNGEDPAKITEQLGTTPEGRNYLRNFLQYHNGDLGDAQHYVAGVTNMLHLYASDDRITHALRTAAPISEQDLRDWVAKPGAYGEPTPTLHTLNGLLVPMSAESIHARSVTSVVNNFTARMFHWLSAAPENMVVRHPLAAGIYRQEMNQSINYAMQRRSEMGLSTELTHDQVGQLQDRAREFARREVIRTVFTIEQRTQAARSLRFVFPFYSAWENVIRRWGGFAIHNPENLAYLASTGTRVLRNMTIINNKTGATGNWEDAMQSPSDYSVMLPKVANMGAWLGDQAVHAATLGAVPAISWKDLKGYKLSTAISSPDVLFQGQPGNPGFGPMVAAPLAVGVNSNPSWEQFTKWAFPVGVPSGVKSPLDMYKAFLPSAINRIVSKDSQDLSYDNARLRILQAHLLAVADGTESANVPMSELEDRAKKFWGLKLAAGLTMPISPQFNNAVTWYASTLRQMRATAQPDLNANQTASQVADSQFLAKHPEAWAMLPSLSDNSTGGYATLATQKNQQRYGDVLALGASIGVSKSALAFVSNYGEGKYNPNDFNQTVYNWQGSTGTGAGGANLRTSQTPDQLIQAAQVQAGWVYFNNMYGGVEATLKARGIDPNDPNLAPQYVQGLNRVRQAIASSIRNSGNEAFWNEYVTKDASRYYDRAQFYTALLSNANFVQDHGSDPLVKSMAAFLSVRQSIANMLIDRSQQPGGSAVLTAGSNLDLKNAYGSLVQDLKGRSLGFSDWYHTNFLGDTVEAHQ